MANEEIKPEDNKPLPPVDDKDKLPPEPNPNTSDEQQKKIKELEEQIKERDAKLAEAQTERATIEARRKEIEAQKLRENADVDTQARLKRITENMSVDPETASAELATLLKERDERISREAEQRALHTVQGQSTIEKIRMGIKTSNPDLDDELVSDVMDKANVFASTGKYKSVEEAVDAATKYVKSKLDNYAQKKNAVPKLPAGASAENGGNNAPPTPPPPPKEESALEELERVNEAQQRKKNLRI